MIEYEYKVIVPNIETGRELENYLNQLGKEGWELITNYHNKNYNPKLIFRRIKRVAT